MDSNTKPTTLPIDRSRYRRHQSRASWSPQPREAGQAQHSPGGAGTNSSQACLLKPGTYLNSSQHTRHNRSWTSDLNITAMLYVNGASRNEQLFTNFFNQTKFGQRVPNLIFTIRKLLHSLYRSISQTKIYGYIIKDLQILDLKFFF